MSMNVSRATRAINTPQLRNHMIRLGFCWNTTHAEQARSYPCDSLIQPYDHDLWRAISIAAPAPLVFRWLCQLRVAPYSYDLIDNRGRRSPPQLTPGIDQIAVGQTVATIFDLIDYQTNRHLTIRIKPGPIQRFFGDTAISYVLDPIDEHTTRLVVKLRVRYLRTLLGSTLRVLLPWGDLVMIHRQLLNFKRLAERDHRTFSAKMDQPARN